MVVLVGGALAFFSRFIGGMVGVRKLLSLVLLVVLAVTGLGAWAPAAQAADTGNAAPQPGKIVSDEPGKNAPNILDGTTYSIAKVGNTIIVGGQFTQVQNYNTSSTLTRANVLAFDATTGKLLTTFAPDPDGTVYKVLPAADGNSVYVAGQFNNAGGQAMPGHLFKINVTTGVIDSSFVSQTISGTIRDLDLVGNHLFVAGKFTHINGIAQKAIGTVYADTGKRDPYFNSVLSGTHNNRTGAATNVLQISINKQNNALMAVGNFMSVDGQSRAQIAKWDIGNVPTGVDTTVHQTLSTWSTPIYAQACSSAFDTNMTDVEFAPNGNFFVVSTTGAYGGSGSLTGTSGCDVVARFENTASANSPATWTAYTGGDTTWTVEVTDNVVYAGGHQRWQNNPTAADRAGQGAVSREGIAALNPVNGMPYSWNPTRSRGTGVQDMLATNDGLYVGSDTDLIGHTAGNTYHGRIAVLPLAGGSNLPQLQNTTLPVDIYKVMTGASQLQRRSNFDGSTAGAATNVPTGPGWGTSTGAFMVNGVLYKVNTDGSLSKMTFDGTSYGTASAVNTSDALAFQTDWHNDAKQLSSIFYSGGFIYYTKAGVNALYRRAFEVEDGVVGQQRFSTTTASINWGNARGAFVAGGKIYNANAAGSLYSATWDQSAHAAVTGTNLAITGAGTGWNARAIFPYQAVPAPLNEAPVAAATVSCNQLDCTFDATASTDPENGPLSYDWDFGDGSAHGTTATATHTYAAAGDRPVTLVVTDNKGATNAVTKTASATSQADSISFVASSTSNGNRTNHSVAVPADTQVGDTLLLFFAANSTGPVYAGPVGWTQVLTQNGSASVGKLFTKTATAADLGTSPTVTSKNANGTTYYVRSDTTLAAYRGVGSPAVSASAITAQNVAGAVHQTPTVNASDGTKWLVSYWTDKSTSAAGTATSWAGPAEQTQRSLGTGSGTSHMSSLVTDSNTRVASGAQGGLNATSDANAQGLTMSVLLSSAGPQPANQSPVAHAALVGCTDLTCSFDGASSNDPDGGALTYDWDWGDNSAHGTTATPSHTFATGGTKTITLTVTDPQNATGTDTVTAAPTAPLANAAPTARITGASCTGLGCSVDGSTSSDPDTDTLTYDWNWGDATAHSTTANPTHAYTTGGAKTVTLTVDDAHGHTSTATTTLNPTVPVTNQAPTARITGASCTAMTCTVDGGTSTDPDGDTLTYDWNWGDSTAHATTVNPSHTYTTVGAKTVTLTVDDGHSHTATATTTLNPTSAAPVSQVAFVGAASSNGNSTSRSTTIPSGVQVGDTLIAFFTANTTTPTYTGPTGWTLLQTGNGNGFVARAWTKTATSAEVAANAKVTVTSTSSAKADLTVSAYRGLDSTTPIADSAIKLDNVAGAAHVSPAVTAGDSTSWLVTYFADKSTDTTGFNAPTGQTVRQGAATASSSGHITALLVDSNAPVAAGANGQLTATANSTSSRGATFSVLLKSH